MKILVIRFSSIGDIVLMTPVFRCLKQQLENVELHFLCKLSFKDVTVGNPYIDHFHYFNGDLDGLATELDKEKFDYIIDLHKNLRTLLLRRKLKTKWLTFRKLSFQKLLLTRLHINTMPRRHITQRSLDTLKPLGVFDDGKGLDYFIPKEEEIATTDLPASHYFGYIAIVIGASYSNKKLPVYKLQQLCALISHPIVLVGGKEDVEDGRQIASVDTIKVYNACGKFTLNGSADIVRKAKMVISHDTGLQYVACAFDKKIIAVWGGTSPLLDVEPYYGSNRLALHTNSIVPGLSCQPCSNFGKNHCPRGHFNCMKSQDMVLMARRAEEMIKQ